MEIAIEFINQIKVQPQKVTVRLRRLKALHTLIEKDF